MPFRFISFSVKGKEKNVNSDSTQIKEMAECWIGVVCDGIGEINEKENIAKLCAETLIEFIINSDQPDPLKKLKSSVEKTNQYIYSLQENNTNTDKEATTLAVLFLIDNTACWGHVGDSRIYKLKNGRLHRLTKDHSIIQQLIDKGFLTLKEAAFHTGMNVVGKAIGEKPKINVDVSKIHLQPNDRNRFLICSDGVTAILSDTEIEYCMRKDKIEDSLQNFIMLVEKYGIPDDSSLIIVDAF